MACERDTAGTAGLAMRPYFSSYHLWAAKHFARLAKEIEDQHTGKNSVFNIKLRAYVTNAVLSAVAFLDASVNEVYDDAADKHAGYIAPLSSETKHLLAGLGRKIKDRSILVSAGAKIPH